MSKKNKAKTEGENGQTETKPKKTRAPYRTRVISALEKGKKSLGRLGKLLARLPSENVQIDAVAAMVEDLTNLVAQVNSLPADWKPAKGTRAGSSFEAGVIVRVREKSASTYDGIFGAETQLKVTAVRSKLLELELPSGAKMLLPKAHFKKLPKLENASA